MVIAWIVLPAFMITVGSLGTDVVEGICTRGVFSSDVVEKAMVSSAIAVTFVMPLMMMLFCYARIIYALRYKVTRPIPSFSFGRETRRRTRTRRRWTG